MPVSFSIFDSVVSHLLEDLRPRTVLDIGCGAGKYGRLANTTVPGCRTVGIEVEASYVDRFKLRDCYDDLRIGNAPDVLRADLAEAYDLAIIGDCIEHMPKSVGLDLLNFLTYRTQYTVVLAPEFTVQGGVNDVDSEAHVSVWSEEDFRWHDRWAWDNCHTISAFILRGYQACSQHFVGVIDRLNTAAVPVYDFEGDKILRPAAFRKEVRLHEETFDGKVYGFRPS